jgi:hypothetical protein
MDRRQFLQTSAAGALLPSLPLEGLKKASGTGVPLGSAATEAATLYVAPSGNDRNPGSEEKPFATLARAKDAVRELKKRTKEPITVWMRRGTCHLQKPLVFEAADSGTSEQPITYAAYPGEFVTLSGGRKLECKWKPYKDGIMMCSLPEVKQANLSFTQLFVNGKRQIRARYPNFDPKNPLIRAGLIVLNLPDTGGGGYINMANQEVAWPATEFHYDPETFTKKRWAKPHEAVVHTFPETYIGNLQWEIKDIDWEAHVVKLGRGGFQINDLAFKKVCTGIGPKSRFYIENVFEELDAPGEWYLDRENGVLYYMPAEGVDLSGAVVEAPVLEHVIEFRGSQENPVKHITLSSFRIAHTTSTFLEEYEAPSLGDWTIHRGGAVLLEGAEDCAVEKCFFDAVGGNAVFINNYNRRIRVYGNQFTEAGDSAVCLVGTRNRAIGSNKPYPAENTISNNLIHDCGVFGKQPAGVFASISEKNTISHNLIYNMPRSAICINDGWGGGHVIEFNEMYDCVRETGDHGSFNSWGRETYWCMLQSHSPKLPGVSHEAGNVKEDCRLTNIVRNNYFHETEFNEWGIDLDDGSSNYHVYNNLMVGVSLTLREGDYRTVENNIMINPKNPPGPKVSYEDNNDTFVRNIIVTSSKAGPSRVGSQPGDCYSIILPPLKGPCVKEMDYNLFFSDIGQFFATWIMRAPIAPKRYTWEEWRALGYDQHSIFADPLFVDAAKGDYRVKPESPALKLGFKNFDLSTVGLLPDFPKEWR